MTAELKEISNMVCRSIANRASKAKPTDSFDRGYFQGQLSIVEIYLKPDDKVLERAMAAVDAMPKCDE